ncbi:hypothetical protein CRENBAI_009532 [Crenichthys baileyi]|uniref:Ankyrin repeat domain-containing protein 31 n=1 Tax=Crenichthys baileyi TaxID=28760 RepID=A0AAV9RSJ5_9TELE
MEEEILSDQDSVSLLQDLPAFQSRAAAEDMAVTTLGSQAANKEIKDKLELNRHKTHKAKTNKGKTSAAGCAASSSRSRKGPTEKLLHKRNYKGETLLHKACQKNDLAQVKLLLQAGVDVNMEDYAGWTALHEASAAGDESVVEELLRAGANVNARSCDGVTPLHDAVYAECYQVVKLLLENGSNPADQNVGGVRALDMATDRNMRELLMTFRASSVGQGESSKGAAQCAEPGSEGGAGGEPTDVQLRQDGIRNNSFTVQSPEAVSAVLEDVGKKQAEISTWNLTDLNDVERCKAAFLQIQSVLTDVLTKQRLEKYSLTHKFGIVPEQLRRVLKGQFLSLASRQRHLVKLLQKQMELEEAYIKAKANISSTKESILGNNIPVSSTYALDKVTFRNKPLPNYLEDNQNPFEIQLQDDVRYNKDGSTQPEPSPEPENPYRLLRKIKIVHLMSCEEFLPDAVMDYYWDKLLKQDPVDFENWELEL